MSFFYFSLMFFCFFACCGPHILTSLFHIFPIFHFFIFCLGSHADIIEFGLRPTYESNSSFSPPAEMIMVIVTGREIIIIICCVIPWSQTLSIGRRPKVIYNIGTEILIFYCFLTKIMNLFSISTIFSAIGTNFRDESFPKGRIAVGAT